jgi:hypothetical protein
MENLTRTTIGNSTSVSIAVLLAIVGGTWVLASRMTSLGDRMEAMGTRLDAIEERLDAQALALWRTFGRLNPDLILPPSVEGSL